jgi:hypothetical protein
MKSEHYRPAAAIRRSDQDGSVGARAYPAALENPANFVPSCRSDRFVGIDHCWIEAAQ